MGYESISIGKNKGVNLKKKRAERKGVPAEEGSGAHEVGGRLLLCSVQSCLPCSWTTSCCARHSLRTSEVCMLKTQVDMQEQSPAMSWKFRCHIRRELDDSVLLEGNILEEGVPSSLPCLVLKI